MERMSSKTTPRLTLLYTYTCKNKTTIEDTFNSFSHIVL